MASPGQLTDSLDRRHLLKVLTALRKGDFSVRMPNDCTGLDGKIADTLNALIDLNERAQKELGRVGRQVGKEGSLNQRVLLGDVEGGWAAEVDAVNNLIEDLVRPMREMARVIEAVAQGDLSQSMELEMDGRPLRGQSLRTARTVNTMVKQLSSFASEVTRVAREVGSEGKLGGQARVGGVAGVWKDLTDNVNVMASNLTTQVRNIADVTTAVANGDLSKKITVDVRGEILELKNTINVMVDQLNAFASEVTRVAREVGMEGKLGGQAQVRGVGGVWKDLTDNVNQLAANLTTQVRNIAEVTTSVARGDLSRKITVDVRGEILELKNTINVMVDQLNAFASEVTRVAREVGTEGKLGGQAQVVGVGGVWKDLTDNVNMMGGNLTSQVRNIAEVTTSVARGDLSKKITVDVRGEILELKNTINVMVDQLNAFASEVTRVAREVGTEGKLGGQARVVGVGGVWKDLTDNVNMMARNLTAQVRNIAEVTTAVARGDLSRKITVDVLGEILELKNTVNVMVDQLNAFASEVTRVAREVGTEGKLGGQAQVKGVAGTWKDLTDNVNSMAANVTDQVRGIARVVTAVANGDLKRKLALEAKGEIAALAETINAMTETLATFADQVTTVAREVGVEGKLGGQASVPGAAGTWKDLTDNVNQLAANLTSQMRAIADVATAVTEGDLTRSIGVQAKGELAVLKDKINEMIRNLRETTQKNTEQDWLKTNLARFSRMLQGQRDMVTVSRLILSELAPLVSAQHGSFYTLEATHPDEPRLRLHATYADGGRGNRPTEFRLGEGLVGQCALEKKRIVVTDLPRDYIKVASGLGEAAPMNLIVQPVLFEGEIMAVIELASFAHFSPTHETFLDQLTESIGIVLNTIEANMRTEDLLQQSQHLFAEAQEASRSKSAFLSMAAHELRTPISVVLGYVSMLEDGSLGDSPPQWKRPLEVLNLKTKELNRLVDDLLLAARVEGGTVPTKVVTVDLRRLAQEAVARGDARAQLLKGELSLRIPQQQVLIDADPDHVGRILDNLINNALTYSVEQPRVLITVSERDAPQVAVEDQGIGIHAEMQERIFERFFRIEDPTIGAPPGTGLGLYIARGLAERHGGSLVLERSEPGAGSRFVLRLPPKTGRPAERLAPAAAAVSDGASASAARQTA